MVRNRVQAVIDISNCQANNNKNVVLKGWGQGKPDLTGRFGIVHG